MRVRELGVERDLTREREETMVVEVAADVGKGRVRV
jgi:hypothetical protein